MKYFWYLFFVLILFASCNKGDSCFTKAGEPVYKIMILNSFDIIDIPKGVSVEIVESVESKIEITSKENYISNLDFTVNNQQLIISNTMGCSLLSNYHIATIRVYTPTLKKIISRTQFKVVSIGTLHFPELFLITSVDSQSASSSFELNIDNKVLTIEDNLVGFFKITGKTQWLNIALFGGTGRVEAEKLKAYDCTFYHRSNNDILVDVENKLSGTIYTTGNVISYSKPKKVDVIEKYKGKLIYK